MSARILIVDDLATNRIVLKVKLEAAQYETYLADSGEQALDVARRELPDLILMDVMMPGLNGFEVCRALKSNPKTAQSKIVLITASDDVASRIEGLEAGADDFLSRPVDEVALLARVRSLLRLRDQERELNMREATFSDMGFAEAQATFTASSSVMVVGRSDAETQQWSQRLGAEDPMAIRAATPSDALRVTVSDTVPDLFVIAVDAGGLNGGLRLMSDLRSRAATRHSACIIVLPQGDSERAATALDLGASDISHDPFLAQELVVRMRTQLARKHRADELRNKLDDGLRLAVIDPLTGLYNRRYGMRHLERIAERCAQQNITSAVLLIDIDHFKVINDTHGHAMGDRFLSAVSQRLRDCLRGEDTVTRIGGEEFMAILPDIPVDAARLVAERLRAEVAALNLTASDGGDISITLSIGVGMMTPKDHDACVTLDTVDKALYSAKSNGRNLVVVAA